MVLFQSPNLKNKKNQYEEGLAFPVMCFTSLSFAISSIIPILICPDCRLYFQKEILKQITNNHHIKIITTRQGL